ncbi:MAG TPA: exosortase/archaeosortase family protein [Bryobacteraceae bacterium]|nr:exosortase/archaeosortase family protein [Bryobacteraceae bacterium]
MSSMLNEAPASDARAEGLPFGVPGLVWFFALLSLCYAPILLNLANQWMMDEDMGHGFFVPVIAGYVAWQKREELAAAPLKRNWLGLVVLAVAAFQSIIGTLGAELFLSRTAFILSVIGCVLFLGGYAAIRVLAFPLFLLAFMIPIPSIIYNRITFPLQLLASGVAETVLTLVGIPVYRDGNVLELPSQKLSVVEACSGIRSLLSLSFLSLVYGYFFDQKSWMKWLLLVATAPIAITANASRVTLTGLLSEINVEYSQGIYHSLSGWVVFMVALVILVIVHQIVNQIYNRVVKSKTGGLS